MALHNAESPEMKKILSSFIKATAMVDTQWLQKEGYLTAECYLPEVFEYTLSTAVKYERLRKNSILRGLLGIWSRLSGLVKK